MVHCQGTTTPEVIRVEFHAADGGSAPLTWGQRSIWKPLQEYGADGHYFNDSRVLDLARYDLPQVLAAWRRMVERHQILRTRFYPDPSGVMQRIERSGSFPVLLYRNTAGSTAATAHQLAEQLTAHSFGLIDDWQVRFAIVTDDRIPSRKDAPIQVVVVVSHLAIDGWAIRVLVDDYLRLLAEPADGGTPATPAGWGPLEQARYEQSPEGRKRNDGALVHWRDRLTAVPRSRSSLAARCPEEPRYHRLNLDSVAVAVAAELLAARCRTSVSAVLLAATTLAVAALTGRRTCVLQLIAGNRFEARRRHTLENAAQDALFVFPIDSTDVTGVIQQVYQSSLTAYLHGCYDPLARDELITEIASHRGSGIDLTWYFNDARLDNDRWEDVDPTGVTEAGLGRLAAETVLYPSGTWQHQDCTFFLHVNRLPGQCRLQLLADTAVIPPKTIEQVLSGMERLLVRAAFRTIPVDEVAALLGLTATEKDFYDG